MHFGDVLLYSPQKLWASLIGVDCYGTIGMSKDFFNIVRSIYPQLEPELDKQLLDFIAWCGNLPDEWEYTVSEDKVCYGWCRDMLKYLCKNGVNSNANTMDIIEFYRNMKVE